MAWVAKTCAKGRFVLGHELRHSQGIECSQIGYGLDNRDLRSGDSTAAELSDPSAGEVDDPPQVPHRIADKAKGISSPLDDPWFCLVGRLPLQLKQVGPSGSGGPAEVDIPVLSRLR
ncbi:hypothetical protein Q31a_14770 [Aureliella helgolandensis]|uniref:Uncharacterized protein n=1 Tax=Aureliella helgolandensis TaxID=2527968 RepID=A0A518G3Q8_9BACT|nr:hypothetical protein Q31a_14770 [Aureliella helgolandensis]